MPAKVSMICINVIDSIGLDLIRTKEGVQSIFETIILRSINNAFNTPNLPICPKHFLLTHKKILLSNESEVFSKMSYSTNPM